MARRIVILTFLLLVPGCDLLQEPLCPEYDCSQCEVTVEDCLEAGLNLVLDGENK